MWSQIFVRFALSRTVLEITTGNVYHYNRLLAIGQTIGCQTASFGHIKNLFHRICWQYHKVTSQIFLESLVYKWSLRPRKLISGQSSDFRVQISEFRVHLLMTIAYDLRSKLKSLKNWNFSNFCHLTHYYPCDPKFFVCFALSLTVSEISTFFNFLYFLKF